MKYFPDKNNASVTLTLNRDQFLVFHYLFTAFCQYCVMDMGVLDTLSYLKDQLAVGALYGDVQKSMDELAYTMNKIRPDLACWCCGETCDEKGLNKSKEFGTEHINRNLN